MVAAVSHASDNRRTLPQLIEELREHEARSNADIITPLNDVRLTAAGHLAIPGLDDEHALTDWSRGQLARLVGLASWDKWFARTSPVERAEEMNRRLARATEEVRVRTAQRHDPNVAGVVRAIVSPEYTPVSDVALATTVREALRGVEQDVRILRASVTDLSTTFVIALGQPFCVGVKEVGLVHGGLLLRNSQVGFARLVANLHLIRLVCTNGMTCPSVAPLIRAVHRHIDLDRVRGRIVDGLADVPAKLHRGVRVVGRSLEDHVQNVEDHVRDVLRDARVSMKLADSVMRAYAREPHASRFGIVQAITRAAQDVSPEVRDAMERAAARYVEGR